MRGTGRRAWEGAGLPVLAVRGRGQRAQRPAAPDLAKESAAALARVTALGESARKELSGLVLDACRRLEARERRRAEVRAKLRARMGAMVKWTMLAALLAALLAGLLVQAVRPSAVETAPPSDGSYSGFRSGQIASFNIGVSTGLILIGLAAALPGRRRWRLAVPAVAGPVPLRRRWSEAAALDERLGALTVAGFVVAVVAEVVAPGFSVRIFAVGIVVDVMLAVGASALLLAVAALWRVTEFAADRRASLLPLDVLLIEFVPVAAAACELAPVWEREDVSRYLVNRLEHLAHIAETSAWPRSRSPLTELALRSEVRTVWLRLAAVLRAHKKAFAAARDRGQHDAAAHSLALGLRACARADWDALLANAPDQVRAGRLLTSWPVTNLLPALVLAACALALPQFAAFRTTALAGEGLRVSLLLYAAVTLLPRQDSPIDLIGTVLGRFGPSTK